MFSATTEIDFSYSSPEQSALARMFIRTIELLTGQAKLRKLYESRNPADGFSDEFFDSAIRLLDLKVDVHRDMAVKIPEAGPVIFIANHPYGVLDGIVFSWLTRQLRPDTRIMANSVLCRAPEVKESLLPVDFSGTREALAVNIHTRKVAMQTLLGGGSVGLFPAGGVGASLTPLSGPALDPEWSPFLARLVKQSGATVVPLFFAGQNSRLFQIASHFSYHLRLALFFFETRRRIGDKIQIAVGEPISGDSLAALADDKAELLRHLRCKTFELAHRLDLPTNRTPDAHQVFRYPAKFGF